VRPTHTIARRRTSWPPSEKSSDLRIPSQSVAIPEKNRRMETADVNAVIE
jgi:hypothetical protein